jgi:hypothetical protein
MVDTHRASIYARPSGGSPDVCSNAPSEEETSNLFISRCSTCCV